MCPADSSHLQDVCHDCIIHPSQPSAKWVWKVKEKWQQQRQTRPIARQCSLVPGDAGAVRCGGGGDLRRPSFIMESFHRSATQTRGDMSSGIHQRIANRSRKLVARCCRRVWMCGQASHPCLTVHAADGNGTRILAESNQAYIQVCRLIGISAVPPGSRTGASDLYLVPIVDRP